MLTKIVDKITNKTEIQKLRKQLATTKRQVTKLKKQNGFLDRANERHIKSMLEMIGTHSEEYTEWRTMNGMLLWWCNKLYKADIWGYFDPKLMFRERLKTVIDNANEYLKGGEDE